MVVVSCVGQYNVENVAERDFLRTEGDPAAVGYTINEAVALIRSMVSFALMQYKPYIFTCI